MPLRRTSSRSSLGSMSHVSQRSAYKNLNSPSPRKAIGTNDGPIRDFIEIIEETRPEEWQKRVNGVAELVDSIPSGEEYCATANQEQWYNSPAALRNLSPPLCDLLKDPRSTVVKRTCEVLSNLFAICQVNARYLLKDLMQTIMSVHAQTVQVIRNYVQQMVCDAIPIVPCKMAMPIWLEKLKVDKSRTVRDACVLYLGLGIQYWNETPGYLSDDNLYQVGTALIKTLRDPSPSVRQNARHAMETIRNQNSGLFDRLVKDPNGPAAKDRKLQNWLIKATAGSANQAGDNADSVQEDYSIASGRYSAVDNRSVRSRSGAVGTPGRSSHRKRTGGSGTPMAARRGSSTDRFGYTPSTPRGGSGNAIPRSIELNTPRGGSSSSGRTMQRRGTTGNVYGNSSSGGGGGLGPPQRLRVDTGSYNQLPPKHNTYANANKRDASNNNSTRRPALSRTFSNGSNRSARNKRNTDINGGGGGFVTPRDVVAVEVVSPISLCTTTPTDDALDPNYVADDSEQDAGPKPMLPPLLGAPAGVPGSTGETGDGDDRLFHPPPPVLSNPPPPRSQLPQEQQPKHTNKGRPPTPEMQQGATPSSTTYLQQVKPQQGSTQRTHVPPPIDTTVLDTTTPMTTIATTPSSIQTQQSSGAGGPFIASMNELKKHASRRRSRRSHILQERLEQQRSNSMPLSSNSPGSSINNDLSNIGERNENEGDHTNVVVDVTNVNDDAVEKDEVNNDKNHLTTTTPASNQQQLICVVEGEIDNINNKSNNNDEMTDGRGDVPPAIFASSKTPTNNTQITLATPMSQATTTALSVTSAATNTTNAPNMEHINIAHQLLRAHKAHVDTIMETLKIEMDALRDFEKAFQRGTANNNNINGGVAGISSFVSLPSEDQVLDYFESVGLCLDQRTTAGTLLLREMDRISRGETL